MLECGGHWYFEADRFFSFSCGCLFFFSITLGRYDTCEFVFALCEVFAQFCTSRLGFVSSLFS